MGLFDNYVTLGEGGYKGCVTERGQNNYKNTYKDMGDKSQNKH